MSPEKFSHLITNPAEVTISDKNYFASEIEKYPYCQSLRLLHLKGLHNEQHADFDATLKSTAIYARDRASLYYLILQQKLNDTIAEVEATANEETEVIAEKPTLEIKQEEPKETKIDETSEEPIKSIEPKPITGLEEQILEHAIAATASIDTESILSELEELPEISPELNEEEVTEEPATEIIPDNSPKSFMDWLDENPESSSTTEQTDKSAENLNKLIDQFITSEPKIKAPKKEFFSPTNVAKLSLVDNEDFVTETLAKIYEQQENYDKAIRIYHKLSLNYPEKRLYFAGRIKNAEELASLAKSKKKK